MKRVSRLLMGVIACTPFFLFNAFSSSSDAFAEVADKTIASRTADFGGVKLHYLTAGHGPPLILLHGYAETSLMWRPIIPVLAERFTVIAPDLPGIGDSDIPADGLDMKSAAVRIHGLARSLGLDAALTTANQLVTQDRDFTAARALKGDIYLAANRAEDAAKAYSDALAAAPSTMLLTRLVGAQMRAGQPDAARAALADWLTKHPKDLVVMEQSAELDITAGRLDEAVKLLQAILTEKPHDPIALNNLAWLYQQQHDPRATDLARQAYVLAPGAQTADTLGWILTASGKADTGVLLLRQASAQAASDPRVQYHYAVALKDTGDKADAIKLLTAVVAVKADFTEKSQAQQLLDELNKGT